MDVFYRRAILSMLGNVLAAVALVPIVGDATKLLPPGQARKTPSLTSGPSSTSTATLMPSLTETATNTPVPTDTPIPTDTPTPGPTDTPAPTPTPDPNARLFGDLTFDAGTFG